MSEFDDSDLENWLKADKKNLPSSLKRLNSELLATLVPAVFLSKMPFDCDEGTPGCWFGGHPRLPEKIDWPWANYDGNAVFPLPFIAEFDLAKLTEQYHDIGLPKRGNLFFFASIQHVIDTGNATVIYVDGDVSAVPQRKPPDMPQDLDALSEQMGWRRFPVTSYDHCPVTLIPYDAVEPNMLLIDGMPAAPERWSLAERALTLQNKMFEPKGPVERGYTGKVLDWVKGTEPVRPRDHPTMHRLFGASTGYSDVGPPDPNVIRLLTVEDDPDWGFQSDSQYLEFFISLDALKQRDFDSAYASMN